MKTILLTVVAALLISFAGFSQSKGDDAYTVNFEDGMRAELTTKELYLKLEGTFEAQISATDYKLLYTRELLETIEASRLDHVNAEVIWDQFTTIIVFPKDALDNVESSQSN